MKASRNDHAFRSGHVPGAAKGSDGIPPPSKKSVSAAVIFKHGSKVAKKTVASPVLHRSALKKSTCTKSGLSSGQKKMGRGAPRNQDNLHPLAVVFNDTTQAYRETLEENTKRRLDDTLDDLLNQMYHFNTTTLSSPSRTSGSTGSPQIVTLAEKVDRTTEKLFRRIGSYNVTTTRKVHGEEHHIEKTLDDGLEEFAIKHKVLFEEICQLEKKWETVVGEICKVGLNYLGEDVMNALLVTPLGAPSPPPAETERDNLILYELDPRSTHKKVKFQDPEQERPRFFNTSSMYKDIPKPVQVSKQDVETLEDSIAILGDPQLKELVKMEEKSSAMWAKKMKGIMDLLDD